MMLRSRLVWTLVRALKLSWWRLIPRLVQALLSALVTSPPHIVAERGGVCTGRVRAIVAMMNAIDSRSVGLVGCASTARVGTRSAAVGHMERVGSGTLAAVAPGRTVLFFVSSAQCRSVRTLSTWGRVAAEEHAHAMTQAHAKPEDYCDAAVHNTSTEAARYTGTRETQRIQALRTIPP
jgi:hypothetical protein